MNWMRLLLLRHVSGAVVNGLITLVILLIAPLGLASVLTCTALISLSTLVVGVAADGVQYWLEDGSTGIDKTP
jgi:hypothetical protein